MSLRIKIIAGYLIVAFMSGLVGIIHLNSMNGLDASFEELKDVTLPVSQTIQQMQIAGESLLRAANEVAFAYSINADQAEIDEELHEVEEATEQLNEGFSRYLELVDLNAPSVAELAAGLQTAVTSLNDGSAKLLTAVQQNASIEDLDEVREALVDSEGIFLEKSGQLFSTISSTILAETTAIDNEIHDNTRSILALRAIAIIIAISLGLFFSSVITKPIKLLTGTAQRMTAGDYSQRAVVNSKDEIGILADAFNKMTEAVRHRERDLTELNQSLEEQVVQRTQSLAESEAKYRLLAENASDMVTQLDSELKYIYVSQAVSNLLGYHPAELIGKLSTDLMHPDDLQNVMRTSPSPTMQLIVRLRHKDGHYIWTESTFQIIPDPKSNATAGIVSVTRDITERKRLEADLEQQRLFLRRVIDFTPSMVFVKDYDGKFVLVNKKLAEIYNVPEDQLIGKGDADFNPNNLEVEAYLQADQEVIESGEPLFIPEEAVTNAEGEIRWFQTTKVPIVSIDGEVQQVLGLATDITDRKRAEAEREKLIKDLQAARRIAEENSRLKSEFLATMSHEIRTPLNAIEGFTSIMLTGMGGAQYNDKAERYITRVNANSKRLLSLVNDFLDLSRIESGRYELADQPFSPAALAQRWRDEMSSLVEKKGLVLDLTLDPHLPETVFGDEEAISKITLNLLSNAIKFTEQGKIGLRVSNGGSNWSISVSDTGIGIPPHAREYIFDEFRQVDQSSRRKYGGTGLGLAIVQKLVRFMGGSVTVDSELGRGSTFTISLPLKSIAAESE